MTTRLTLAALAAAAGLAPAAEPSWPQFRGPNGAGVAADAPPARLDLAANVRWKVPLPAGASSPAVWGGRIFLTAFENGKLYTLGLDRADGRVLWKTEAPAGRIEDYHRTEGSPAASTPACDGTRVVSYFGSCGLFCYDFDGKELWRYPLPVAETNNKFGTGTSPILAGGLAVLVRDLSKDSAVYALDAATGKPVWKADRAGFPTSYSTPAVWDVGGRKELVVPGYMRLKSYDLATGEELWTVNDLPAAVCTTPVVGDGLLLFAGWSPGNEDFPLPPFDAFLEHDANKNGSLEKAEAAKTFLKDFFESNDTDGDGSITRKEWDEQLAYMKRGRNFALAVRPGGRGDVTKTHVAWKVSKGLPYVPSPVYADGRLYLVKDGGLATCLDAKTGKAVYLQERLGAGGTYYSSPVIAGGHVYALSLEGVLTVYAAGDRPAVASRVNLGEPTKATPAVAGGELYVRTAGHLWAFGAGR